MTPDSALNLVNHAAQQSATWHLIALVLIGILFVIAIFRWFTRRMELLEGKMDTQSSEFISHLKTANQEMLGVIASAKAVIERVERKLEKP